MSNHFTPLISIIVAVFNGAKTLQQCINSIAFQTYPHKELIIIDNSSKDGTVDLLNANSGQINYWISEPDSGIFNAWNKGLAKAKGEWICFLGADDYFWNTRVLEKISEQLEKLPPNIRVAYGQIMIVNECGEGLYRMGESWQKIKKHFHHLMSIPHIGTMHRRSLFDEYGKYDESFRIAGDYELLLREFKANDAFFIQDVIVAAMRDGGVSSVAANYLQVVRENRLALEMHGHYLPRWFWLKATAKSYIKLMLLVIVGKRLTEKALNSYRHIIGLPTFWHRV